MRIETLEESRETPIELSAEQEAQLRVIGRRLAQGTDRFGQPIEDSTASLIGLSRVDAGSVRVVVRDAVGVVAIPGLQLIVEPKIPQDHLVYLVQQSRFLPRIDSQAAQVKSDDSLHELIARWFMLALERLLQEGLARGYEPVSGRLDTVRGRVNPMGTARLYYAGRLAVVAEYEEYDFDTPLNRVLASAARVLARGVALPNEVRRRAIRALKQMEGIGPLRHGDLHARPDRMTAHYIDSVAFAREILKAAGRAIEAGGDRSWTFLFRTADPVESGIRAVLTDALKDLVGVRKQSIALGGSTTSVNPDLVFGNIAAVGDVKYKIAGDEWVRPDLYEVVAFGAAAEVTNGILIDFRRANSSSLGTVKFGQIEVREASWDAAEGTSPQEAAKGLGDAVAAWVATAVLEEPEPIAA